MLHGVAQRSSRAARAVASNDQGNALVVPSPVSRLVQPVDGLVLARERELDHSNVVFHGDVVVVRVRSDGGNCVPLDALIVCLADRALAENDKVASAEISRAVRSGERPVRMDEHGATAIKACEELIEARWVDDVAAHDSCHAEGGPAIRTTTKAARRQVGGCKRRGRLRGWRRWRRQRRWWQKRWWGWRWCHAGCNGDSGRGDTKGITALGEAAPT